MSSNGEKNKEQPVEQPGIQALEEIIQPLETTDTLSQQEAHTLVPQGIDESGIEIGASSEEVQEEDDAGLYLGDRLKLTTTKYGLLKGRIYYLDTESLIRIMPDGVSNRIYDIPIVDGDLDPDLGIIGDIEVINKGPRVGFLSWQGFRVEQTLYSFKPDGSMGSLYTVTSINEEKDRLTLRDESDAEIQVDFAFKGIPQDLPFTVLAIKSLDESEKPLTPEEIQEEELAIAKAQTPGADAAEAFGEDLDFIDLGDLDTIVGTFYIQEAAEIGELSTSERIYSELAQKSELLADLISMLDIPSQRNPLLLKRIRALVELCSSLKNSIIRRSRDGRPIGEELVSLTTLADVLRGSVVPIARPVLETDRILISETADSSVDSDQLVVKNLVETIKESEEFLTTQGNIPAFVGGAGIGIPRWYQALNSYFTQFPLGDVYQTSSNGEMYSFVQDGEYFRSDAPGSDALKGLKRIGSDKTQNKQYANNPADFVGSIAQSLRRGHGPITRESGTGGVDIVSPADKATVTGYILFPYKAILSGAIGATRTGLLWDAVLRSKSEKVSIESLLTKLGGVKEERDAQNIFYVDVDDSSAIGVSFSEFMKLVLQSIVLRGPGDMNTIKYDLGIVESELTVEQQAVVETRVKEVIGSLYAMIRQMRAQMPPSTSVLHSFTDNLTLFNQIEAAIHGHPLLESILKDLARRTPGYKQVDIAIMGSFLHYAKDYALSVLAGNKRRADVERITLKREIFLRAVQDSLRLQELQRSLGQPPQRNPCPHTDALETIRRITDQASRMGLLTKFIRLYKGSREENWIQCSVCKEHLLCHHEILQIQQFLHPNEKDILQKQIVLDYAGGLAGSNYICRNCGLPISELDFDKSIEYDDQGRPMMGREVLIDTDDMEQKELNRIFSLTKEVVEDAIVFDTDKKKELYAIARTIADKVGVSIDSAGYKKVVERANAELLQLPSEQSYTKLKTASKEKQMIDYTKYVSRIKIGYTAALLLLEIQTHAPDYILQFALEGCRAGFGGYPLQREIEGSDALVGIQYVACAVSGIQRTDLPWIEGFQTISNKDDKRTQYIADMMKKYLTKLSDTNVSVQQDLDKKRTYIQKLFGDAATKGRHEERLLSNFLPRMERLDEASENAVKAPSIPEGARGTFGEVLKADAWIRAVNKLAKEHTTVIKGSPFAEAACCFSEIAVPGKVLRETSLPPLPISNVLLQSFTRRTIAYTPMIPRALQPFHATPALSGAYRVFLQLCWKGPRVGLPHELGYDLKCDWCDTEVFSTYRTPDVDKEGTPILNEQALRSQFDQQGIPVTEQSFQALLDASHMRTAFTPYRTPIPPTPTELLSGLAAIETVPVVDWSSLLNQTMEQLNTLSADPADIQVIEALNPLRSSLSDAETALKKQLGEAKYTALTSLVDLPPQSVIEIMRSYFLVPSQRLVSNYDASSFLRVQKYYKLANDHVDAVNTILQEHTDYLSLINLFPEDDAEYTQLEKARIKLETYVNQLSAFLKQANELRISRLRYTMKLSIKTIDQFLKELLRVVIIGPLGDLINPSIIPDSEEYEGTDSGKSDILLRVFINTMLNKYEKEYLVYNPAIVKQKLEESKEREKQRFIGDMDKLSEDDRRIELMKKRLGLGKWSIGGTKLVYAYDPDQWEKNREELQRNYVAAAGLGTDVGPGIDDGLEHGGDTGEGGYDNFDNHGDGDEE